MINYKFLVLIGVVFLWLLWDGVVMIGVGVDEVVGCLVIGWGVLGGGGVLIIFNCVKW